MQRQHHVRGRADWRTCSQPCLPLPTRLDRPAPPAVSNLEGMWAGRYHCFSTTATTPSSRNQSCDRARRLEHHQSSSLSSHPLPFQPYSLDVPSFEPPPHTHPSSVGPAPAKPPCYRLRVDPRRRVHAQPLPPRCLRLRGLRQQVIRAVLRHAREDLRTSAALTVSTAASTGGLAKPQVSLRATANFDQQISRVGRKL